MGDIESGRNIIHPSHGVSQKAIALGITPGIFQEQLQRANVAYNRIVDLGPFYGENIRGQDPSFRISAQPLLLPTHLKSQYQQLGQDVYSLACAIPSLPDTVLSLMGKDWSAMVPFLWRMDSIVDGEDRLFVNEIQISDGCNGRMTGLQLAYGLTTLQESTQGSIVNYLVDKYNPSLNSPPRVAFIRHNITDSPYAASALRTHEFLVQAADGKVDFHLTDKNQLESTDWSRFDGIINYAFIRAQSLLENGITEDQILCPGDACYIGSKALFVLVHDSALSSFWQEHLGTDTFDRLKRHFIKSNLVKDASDIKNAKDSGFVVKIFNTERLSTLGASRGVFGPWDISDETWQNSYIHLDEGSGLLTQEFVKPKKFPILLRNDDGSNLQRMDWYSNRISAHYVLTDISGTNVALTGLEATLGESEKLAIQESCITSVDFKV
ncbi:MAG: hypothetical protein Q8Q65_04005 [bacterium]|nr:hypothetical protein [bacterium]